MRRRASKRNVLQLLSSIDVFVDDWTRYVIRTWMFLFVAALAVPVAVFFGFQHRWFLVVICVLMLFVALDNAFCGTRLRTAGCSVKGHYVKPHFRRPRA